MLQPRLYGATLVCSLFFSALVFSLIGAKKGLSLSMGLSLVHKDLLHWRGQSLVEQLVCNVPVRYAVYVGLFATAASMCARPPAGSVDSQCACSTGMGC